MEDYKVEDDLSRFLKYFFGKPKCFSPFLLDHQTLMTTGNNRVQGFNNLNPQRLLTLNDLGLKPDTLMCVLTFPGLGSPYVSKFPYLAQLTVILSRLFNGGKMAKFWLHLEGYR